LYIDGFYGQSGEAYVAEPLQLATVWNIMGRLSWGLWGNSMEVLHTQEKSKPSDVVDNATKIDVTSYEVRLNLLDDMGYFVDTKESSVGLQQADAEYRDLLERSKLELSKVYADYENSLRNLRTLKNEIELKERKLDLFRKRNELYEVPTVQVMEECWKYAETISSYARSLYTNYASVTELERMTLMTLR
jgi:hypothetical protein